MQLIYKAQPPSNHTRTILIAFGRPVCLLVQPTPYFDRLLQCQSFRWHVMLFCVKLDGLSENIASHSINIGWGGGVLSTHSLQAQVITIEAYTSLPMLNCLEA